MRTIKPTHKPIKIFGISRFGLEKILELDLYRKHPLINFAKIFSSR